MTQDGSTNPIFLPAAIVVRPRFIWGRGDTVLRPMLTQAFNDGSFKFITPPAKTSTCHVINVCHALRLAATAKGRGEQNFVSDLEPQTFFGAVLPDFRRPIKTSDDPFRVTGNFILS